MNEKQFMNMINNYYDSVNDFEDMLLMRTIYFKNQATESPNEFFNKALKKATDIVNCFESLYNVAQIRNIDEKKVYREIRDKRGRYEFYWEGYDELHQYVYLPIYHIYRELMCLNSYLNITDDEIKKDYQETIDHYEEAIANWMDRFPNNTDGFNYINHIVTESTFEFYIRKDPHLKEEYHNMRKRINKDIKVDKSIYTYPDNIRYEKSYLFYSLLWNDSKDSVNNQYFISFCNEMLGSLHNYIDEENRFRIQNTAYKIVKDKKTSYIKKYHKMTNKQFQKELIRLYNIYGNIIGYFCGHRDFAERWPNELENTFRQGIDLCELFLEQFKKVKVEEERRNTVYDTMYLDRYGEADALENQRINRYKYFYEIFEFLKCIKLLDFIKSDDLKQKIDELIEQFLDYYYDMVIIYTRYERYKFSKEYIKVETETLELVFYYLLDEKTEIVNQVEKAKEDILSKMNLEMSSKNQTEKEKNIFRYMYYYLLPKYLKDDDARELVNKVSERILDKLSLLMDGKDIINIQNGVEDYLKSSEKKKGIKQ